MTTPDLPATIEGLTPKQTAFVHHYVATHNASQAARQAGYSPRTAGVQGYSLLKRPHIAAAIEEREAKLADELGLTAQWALDRLADVIRISLSPTPKTYQGGIVRSPCEEGCDSCPHVVMEIDGGTAHAALRTLMQHRGMLDSRSRVELASVLYEVVGVDVRDLS